jgi:hypothetical protein
MSEPQSLDIALAGRWDSSVLEPLAEINEEVMEALTCAGRPAGSDGPALGGLRWRWQALGAPARRRLVRCPYLLLDAGFGHAELWAALPRASVHEVPPVREFTTRPQPMPVSLIRRVLLLAWHLARANRLTARLALGMSAECAQLLARCRLADLDWYAEQRPEFIRPRWEHRPALWHALMAAAALEKSHELERLQSWGLQMLAAETLSLTTSAVTSGARLR